MRKQVDQRLFLLLFDGNQWLRRPCVVRGFYYLLLPGSSGSIIYRWLVPLGAGRACPKLVACIVRVRMVRPYILRRIVSLRPRHGSVAGRQVSIWRVLSSSEGAFPCRRGAPFSDFNRSARVLPSVY